MRKLMLAAAFALFATPALAGSCPAKIAMIDQVLATGDVPNAEQVKELRDNGEQLHNEGDHAESVEVLLEAMELAGIEG